MRHSIRRPGVRNSLAGLALLAGLTTGCIYGFAGGGLPPDIKTVAVLPFDNQTADPTLTQAVTQAVTDAMEGRLGLRRATEASADAIVRGAILNYQSDIPLSFQSGNAGNVQVTARRVQITLRVEIYDQKSGKTLWQATSMTVDGEYSPPQETDGRQKALDKLVANIVDGAQSQW